MLKEQWEKYKQQFKEAIADLKTKGRRKYQIPNILTSMRLLAPFFILPAAFTGNVPLVFVFVGTFSVTDLLDGFIARKFHLTSDLGRDLDAFCDKIFAGTLLLGSSFMNPTLLFNFGLEALIAGTNTKAKLEGMDVRSLLIGKVKTFFLFPLIGLGFVSKELPIEMVVQSGVVATALLQIVTFHSYQRKYKEYKEEKERIHVEPPQTIIPEEEKEKEKSSVLEKKETMDFRPTVFGKRKSQLENLRQMKTILMEEVGMVPPEKIEEEKKYLKKREE